MICMSILCILLFATSSLTTSIFGDIGIIATSFLVIMYGSGMLTEVDFNSMSWHTLVLVGGGNVLGKAVQTSGLLAFLTRCISASLPVGNVWLSFVLLVAFTGVVATFVSHTVAAIIMMPVLASIGEHLHDPVMIVIGSALAISAAMTLPFSSFPNVNSLLMQDDFHR